MTKFPEDRSGYYHAAERNLNHLDSGKDWRGCHPELNVFARNVFRTMQQREREKMLLEDFARQYGKRSIARFINGR